MSNAWQDPSIVSWALMDGDLGTALTQTSESLMAWLQNPDFTTLEINDVSVSAQQNGSTTVTTDGSGNATITYPPFPGGVDNLILACGTMSGAGNYLVVQTSGVGSNGSFNVNIVDKSGATVNGTAIVVNWLVFGH